MKYLLLALVMGVKKVCLCYVLPAHDWTSAAMKGIPPTPKQIQDGVDGFWDYAKLYCERCGVESEVSKEAPWTLLKSW